MIKLKLKIYAYAILGLAFITFAAIFVIHQDLSSIDLQKTLKDVSYTISINFFIWLGFVKWWWKWKLFHGWLVPFPNLSGKWKGHLKPNWENAKHEPIPTEIEIKQTFFHMTIRLKTGESESFSNSASFDIDVERNINQLFYSYTNYPKPSVREKSQIHYGTTLLKFNEYPVKNMTGEYWTSRESTGEIEIEKEE
jgi:hypothetical protein